MRDEESIATLILAVVAIILAWFLVIAFVSGAFAHESWISRGAYRNPLGEWCCGDLDCKSYSQIRSTPAGWMINGEFIPYDEALPIAPPEGDVVVCRRPDGSRRCVFGLKPGL